MKINENTSNDRLIACDALNEAELMSPPKLNRIYLFFKRLFDIVAALAAILIFLLPMLVLILMIKIDSPGPAIFKQKRIGKNGIPFTIYKFRSMRTDAPSDVATRELGNTDAYTTKLGAFIRKTSLDELPQLINILNGTMSFVGYRPVCLTEVKLNEMRQQYGVFSVRPGLTGLAQVKGRDNVSAQDKAKMDAEYVRNCTIKMDLWCFFKTIEVVFSREGAN